MLPLAMTTSSKETTQMPSDLVPFDPSIHTPQDVGFGGPSTEVTITVDMPDGTISVIPSVWWDKDGNPTLVENQDKAVELAQEYEKNNNKQFPRFGKSGNRNSYELADSWAQRRSANGGASNVPLAYDLDPPPSLEDKFAPARGLMELVGQKESNGDYNVAYGGTKDNFTNMTVDEVLKWQDDYVDAGSKSSAVGKYQIIRKTLRDLKKKMKLTGDEVFSPEMQDAMFVQLLKKRDYDKWVDGKIDDEAFANNLAKEWASFPVMNDMQGHKTKVKAGQSYYANDGLNRALISPSDVRDALDSYRTPAQEKVTYAELAGNHDPYYAPYGRTNLYRVTTRNGVPLEGAVPDPNWHGDSMMAEAYYTDRPFTTPQQEEQDPVESALQDLFWLDKNIK